MPTIRNLDEVAKEHFDFVIKGHTYRFTHPTVQEIKEFDSDKQDEAESTKKFFKFISKVDPKSPDWEKIFEQLTVPHVKAFKSMIEEEFSV